MKSAKAGDTLIEVLFAFAILSLVISVMFRGAMSSYKSAVTAQERTQALFLAQYQADALKTYRDSLAWNQASGISLYTYLDGDKSGSQTTDLVATAGLNNFCMESLQNVNTYSYYWKIQQTTTTCDSNAKALAPNLNNVQLRINTSPDSPTDSQTAIITVSWQPKNSSVTESVVNTILLTKQR